MPNENDERRQQQLVREAQEINEANLDLVRVVLDSVIEGKPGQSLEEISGAINYDSMRPLQLQALAVEGLKSLARCEFRQMATDRVELCALRTVRDEEETNGLHSA